MDVKDLKILVLGYGSREHALAWKIAQSPRVAEVFVAPGNAGTAEIATNVPISDEDVESLVDFALENQIDLTVVGPNDPLAYGVVDAFEAAGLAIFGPSQGAAQLESSKAFAKEFMQRHGIPTPAFHLFQDFDAATAHLNTLDPDQGVIVKVSGLGKQGMGVSVCDNVAQAHTALKTYMVDQLLGQAANTVIIEERLHGSEVSIFALSDSARAVALIPVRDHKRIYDNDQGPNTGGMGAYGPPTDIDQDFIANVMDNVIQPTIDGMAAEGNPYVGVLYAGLMVTDDGYQVLEYNCRFGNPEALVIMALLESDLVELMLCCVDGALFPEQVKFRDGAAAAVVIASPDYPAEEFPTGLEISGLAKAQGLDEVEVFHHGTVREDGKLVTSRGRVLAVMSAADELSTALDNTYAGVRHINFAGSHYRSDVGLLGANIPDPLAI